MESWENRWEDDLAVWGTSSLLSTLYKWIGWRSSGRPNARSGSAFFLLSFLNVRGGETWQPSRLWGLRFSWCRAEASCVSQVAALSAVPFKLCLLLSLHRPSRGVPAAFAAIVACVSAVKWRPRPSFIGGEDCSQFHLRSMDGTSSAAERSRRRRRPTRHRLSESSVGFPSPPACISFSTPRTISISWANPLAF